MPIPEERSRQLHPFVSVICHLGKLGFWMGLQGASVRASPPPTPAPVSGSASRLPMAPGGLTPAPSGLVLLGRPVAYHFHVGTEKDFAHGWGVSG